MTNQIDRLMRDTQNREDLIDKVDPQVRGVAATLLVWPFREQIRRPICHAVRQMCQRQLAGTVPRAHFGWSSF